MLLNEIDKIYALPICQKTSSLKMQIGVRVYNSTWKDEDILIILIWLLKIIKHSGAKLGTKINLFQYFKHRIIIYKVKILQLLIFTNKLKFNQL